MRLSKASETGQTPAPGSSSLTATYGTTISDSSAYFFGRSELMNQILVRQQVGAMLIGLDCEFGDIQIPKSQER